MITDVVMALRNEIKANDAKQAFDKDVVCLRGFILQDTSHLDEIKVYDSAVIKGLSFQAVKKFRPFVNMFSEN
jgi:flagellar biosynthesis regulator FlbT